MKVEFHIHTRYSRDSAVKLSDINKVMKKNDMIPVITDHNEIKGALLYKKKYGECIIGEEINSSEGEIIGLFLKTRIKPGLSPEETVKEIRNQGGLVYVPHPFDTWRRNTLKTSNLEIIKPDIMEIFNKRTLSRQADAKAQEYAMSNNLVQVAGSDSHTRTELGKTYMDISNLEKKDLENPKEFLKKLRKAELIISKRSPPYIHVYTRMIKYLKKLEIL